MGKEKTLRSQVGTMTFTLPSQLLLKDTSEVLMDIPEYPHHVRLTKKNNKLVYKHTIPSTMTRSIELDLKEIAFDWDESFISLSWAKDYLRITLQPHHKSEPFYIQKMNKQANEQIKVTTDGKVFDLGSSSSGFHFHQKGEYMSKPFAIEHWGDTKKYIKILLTGESDDGYMFECALCNLLLVSLVTGLEAYMKTRFIELYQEGVPLDTAFLVKKFSKKENRDNDVKSIVSDEALIKYAKRNINFQHYEKIRDAFKAFGISIHDCIDSTQIAKIKTLIGYRHRIIHYSISLSILNIEDYGSEPVFQKKAFIEESIKDFDEFVTQLHSASSIQ